MRAAAETVAGEVKERSLEHWLLLACAPAIAALLCALALFVEPDPRGYGTHEQLGMPPCRAMQLFGVPCPVCGVTTSVALAARGRFGESLRNQPLGFALALSAGVFLPWAILGHLRGRDLARDLGAARSSRGVVLLVLTVSLAAWLYKVWIVCLRVDPSALTT